MSVPGHEVTAEPVLKMDADGPIGWRFYCSCGRIGRGNHPTEQAAIWAGHDHIPTLGSRQPAGDQG